MTALADPEKLRELAAHYRRAHPRSIEWDAAAHWLDETADVVAAQAAEIAEQRACLETHIDAHSDDLETIRQLRHQLAAAEERATEIERLRAGFQDKLFECSEAHAKLKSRLFEMQNAAIDVTQKLAAAEAERDDAKAWQAAKREWIDVAVRMFATIPELTKERDAARSEIFALQQSLGLPRRLGTDPTP